MNMKPILAAAAAVGLLTMVPATADAAVVYSSIPNLNVSPILNAWCSDCYGGGTYEPLDNFTLGSSASISGLNLVTQTGYYEGLSGFTLEVYNSSHSAILFSEAISPTLVANTAYNTSILTGTVSGLSLGAGNYWIGFIAPVMGVPGFSGGNGSLIDTTPHTGIEVQVLGGDTGYQLLSAVPEPSTWAMMLLGFAGLGFAGYRRTRARLAVLRAAWPR
jgi:hypothetical protein